MPMTLKLSVLNWGLRLCQVCPNDVPWLTLTYFKSWLNWFTKAFVWEKFKTVEFPEAVIAYDFKADLCNQLNEFYVYQKSRSFADLS